MNRWKKNLTVAFVLCLLCAICPRAAAKDNDTVFLGGMPFGLKLYTSGVLVINVDTYSSADMAGIKKNDVIMTADDEEITSNEQLKEIITTSQGEDIELLLSRDNTPITVTLTPGMNDDSEYEAGLWVRDSTAGLGTVTYFDESTMSFGALGHGVCDRDTGMLMPLKNGEIMDAQITSITRAERGVAGGLNGYMSDTSIGSITLNNAFGVYGRYHTLMSDTRIQCAGDEEITTGDATLYATVDDSGVTPYKVEIETVTPDNKNGQNMVVRVTDETLLQKTGGIVQGMSGSPIVQNGKLVGAVTHVFVNAPEKGYGISIGNMRRNYASYGGITG